MVRQLLFFACLFGSCRLMAQTANAAVKAGTAAPEVDYRVMGAPMPTLRYVLYHDTATAKNDAGNINTATPASSDAAITVTHKSRRKRRHDESVNSESGSSVPANKSILNNKDLDNGADLFVMIFNPTCSHCQDETRMLEKNGNLFKQSKIALLASPQMGQYLGDFVKYTQATQYPSFIYLGIDSSDFTKKVFVYGSLPQINVYDKSRKLVKTFNGEVPIDSLSKYIQ